MSKLVSVLSMPKQQRFSFHPHPYHALTLALALALAVPAPSPYPCPHPHHALTAPSPLLHLHYHHCPHPCHALAIIVVVAAPSLLQLPRHGPRQHGHHAIITTAATPWLSPTWSLHYCCCSRSHCTIVLSLLQSHLSCCHVIIIVSVMVVAPSR